MPSSTGLDRNTGKPLSDFAHVQQSIAVLFVTRIGSRVMRRTYGAAVPPLMLRNLTQRNLARVFAAMIMAIDLWEPRFKVVSVTLPTDLPGFNAAVGLDLNLTLPSAAGTNSPAQLRQGAFGVRILGLYRPLALQGDFTPAKTPRAVVL